MTHVSKQQLQQLWPSVPWVLGMKRQYGITSALHHLKTRQQINVPHLYSLFGTASLSLNSMYMYMHTPCTHYAHICTCTTCPHAQTLRISKKPHPSAEKRCTMPPNCCHTSPNGSHTRAGPTRTEGGRQILTKRHVCTVTWQASDGAWPHRTLRSARSRRSVFAVAARASVAARSCSRVGGRLTGALITAASAAMRQVRCR